MLGVRAGPRRSHVVMSAVASNEQLHQWDREHYWHAFTQMAEYEPFLIERANGVYCSMPMVELIWMA